MTSKIRAEVTNDGHHLVWTFVSEEDNCHAARGVHMERAEVPGGWLYRATWEGDVSGRVSTSIAFVPAPKRRGSR